MPDRLSLGAMLTPRQFCAHFISIPTRERVELSALSLIESDSELGLGEHARHRCYTCSGVKPS